MPGDAGAAGMLLFSSQRAAAQVLLPSTLVAVFLSRQRDLFSNATQPRVLGIKGSVLGEVQKFGCH